MNNEYFAEAGESVMTFLCKVRNDTIKRNLLYSFGTINDIRVTVSRDSNINDLCLIYDLKRRLSK